MVVLVDGWTCLSVNVFSNLDNFMKYCQVMDILCSIYCAHFDVSVVLLLSLLI